MKVGACARLMRPINSVMVGFAVIVGAVIASGVLGESPTLKELVFGFATGYFISAAAMILNDIIDIEIDRVNAPHRPMPAGLITVREAYACFTVASLLGLATSTVTGTKTLGIGLLALTIAVVYDVWGKRSGLPGNLMVAAATSMPFLYAMALLDCFCEEVLIFWTIVFLTVLAREIAKDIADIEGDKIAGARTLPIILGRRRAAIIVAILYIAAVALSPLPLLEGRVNMLAYAPLVAFVDIILVYESARIVRNQDKDAILEHKRNVLIAMLIGLVAFLAGSVA